MQNAAYLIIQPENVKVLGLYRLNLSKSKSSWYVSLKLRHSGKDGIFLEDESVFLSENRDKLKELLNGKVINL